MASNIVHLALKLQLQYFEKYAKSYFGSAVNARHLQQLALVLTEICTRMFADIGRQVRTRSASGSRISFNTNTLYLFLQYFDVVGWVTGRASDL